MEKGESSGQEEVITRLNLSAPGKVPRLFCFVPQDYSGSMKKTKSKSKKVKPGTFYVAHVNRVLVKPLARQIRQHEVESLKREDALLERLEAIGDSLTSIERLLQGPVALPKKLEKSRFRIWPFGRDEEQAL
jgi:hypothetical protein